MLHSVTEFWVPRVISSADQPKQQINAFLAKNANCARPAWGVLDITKLLARRYRFAYHFPFNYWPLAQFSTPKLPKNQESSGGKLLAYWLNKLLATKVMLKRADHAKKAGNLAKRQKTKNLALG